MDDEHKEYLEMCKTPTKDSEALEPPKVIEIKKKPSWAVDFAEMLAHVIVWNYIGVLIRIYTTKIARYTSTGFFSALYAEMFGSLFMGFILEHKPAINPNHPNFYVGLGTALCGSCTTFSSWMADALTLVVRFPNSIYEDRGNDYRVLSYVSIIWIGFTVAYGAFFFGRSLAKAISPFAQSPLREDLYSGAMGGLLSFYSRHEYLVVSIELVTVMAVCLVPLGVFGVWDVFFSLIWGPIGVLIRFYLGKYLNRPERPYGTFAANVLGCVVYGLVSIWNHEVHYGP
eukprot:Ihof_evm1s302 gene=Ihof_evmTU1s302